MTYTVTTTSGTALATIADSTVNKTATSLTLIGKNYAGYGIFLNENYVKLLEHFASSTSPSSPLAGQLWFDLTNKALNFYDGISWKPLSAAQSTAVAPVETSRAVGDIWWDLNVSQLKAWSGTEWITIGPMQISDVPTAPTSVLTTVISDGILDHPAIIFMVQSAAVTIISNDSTYTPSPAIPGFSTIIRGVNLMTTANAKYIGTSVTSETLGSSSEGNFLRKDGNTETAYTVTMDKLAVSDKFELDGTATTTRLNSLLPAANLEVWVGSSIKSLVVSNTGEIQLPALPLAIDQGGTGSRVPVDVRASLGLGTISTQNANLVAITGGTLAAVTITSLSTPITITQGGTGGGNLTVAKTNLQINNVTNESKTTMFASPTFTGTPRSVTMSVSDSSNAIATTAFVTSYVAAHANFGAQLWQNVKVSRAHNVVYQNTTTLPITVYVRTNGYFGAITAYTGSSAGSVTIEIASDHNYGWYYNYGANNAGGILFVIPPGKYYKVLVSGAVLSIWHELR